MIRIRNCETTGLIVRTSVFLFALLILTVATSALASDHDGVNGYSMTLKAKTFDSGGGTSTGGGGGLVVETTQSKRETPSYPQEVRADRFALVLRVSIAWYLLLLR